MEKKVCEIRKFSESENPVRKIKEVPKKIICVSIFIKEYDQGFKEKYEENCINLLRNYKKYLPDFQLILFTDDTICKSRTIKETIERSDLNVIIYNCEKLIEKSTKEHKGLIGTIMRYYPLFEREYRKAELIIITDIDLKHYNFKNIIHCVEYMQKNSKVQFLFKTNGVLFQNEWGHQEYPQIISIIIIARRQFPMKIFEEFLEKITQNKRQKLKGVRKANHQRVQELSYGIDEYFLNYYLMRWIVENNVLYSITTNWDYKLILYSLKIDPNDQYTDNKLNILGKLRKKDLKYINWLLDKLKVKKDDDIIKRCSYIDLGRQLSQYDMQVIEDYILYLNEDRNQRIYTPWQIKFILYNMRKKSSIIFLTLKKLKIIEEDRIEKNFNWWDQVLS